MTPALQLSITLCASLLLWVPTIPAAVASDTDPFRIALHYLLALLVSRVGVGLLFRIVNGYADSLESDAETDEGAEDRPTSAPAGDIASFGRRRDDLAEPATQPESSPRDPASDDREEADALAS